MGRYEPKKSKEITVLYTLNFADSQSVSASYKITTENSRITHAELKHHLSSFIDTHQIKFEVYMFWWRSAIKEALPIKSSFDMSIDQIFKEQEVTQIMEIHLRTSTLIFELNLSTKIQKLEAKIEKIEKMISQCVTIEELRMRLNEKQKEIQTSKSIPEDRNFHTDKLDMCVLFSEPLMNQKQDKEEATDPVDFRAEIERLKTAMESSFLPFLSFKCEIATKQNIKASISLKRLKILHIICHGNEQGELQLQDDSKTVIGVLSRMRPNQIEQMLKKLQEKLPELVFVNSCFSETSGRMFFKMGVRHVIMISAKDTINDYAAQIFSQNFYRNIFRGESVSSAFKQAKQHVADKHISTIICCCGHLTEKPHLEGCKWIEILTKVGIEEAHKKYHIPCHQCCTRHGNNHDLKCEWARDTLMSINDSFQRRHNGVDSAFTRKELNRYDKLGLPICCCFNFNSESSMMTYHNESEKFKMLSKDEEGTQVLYEIKSKSQTYTCIRDETALTLRFLPSVASESRFVGRQQQLFTFLKSLRKNDIQLHYLVGKEGIGKTSFVRKAANYLIERDLFDKYFLVNLRDVRDEEMFQSQFLQRTNINLYEEKDKVLLELKFKRVIVILDDCDNFLRDCKEKLEQFMKAFRKKVENVRYVVLLNDKAYLQPDDKKFQDLVPAIQYEREILPRLGLNQMNKILYYALKEYMDSSIVQRDTLHIVRQNQETLTPKNIATIQRNLQLEGCKTKYTLENIKEQIKMINKSSSSSKCEKNVDMFKEYPLAYFLLMFLAQFIKGLPEEKLQYFQCKIPQGQRAVVTFLGDKEFPTSISFNFTKSFLDNPDTSSHTGSHTSSYASSDASYYTVGIESGWIRRKDGMISAGSSLKAYLGAERSADVKECFLRYLSTELHRIFQKYKQDHIVCQRMLNYSSLSTAEIFAEEPETLSYETHVGDEAMATFNAMHSLDLWQIYRATDWLAYINDQGQLFKALTLSKTTSKLEDLNDFNLEKFHKQVSMAENNQLDRTQDNEQQSREPFHNILSCLLRLAVYIPTAVRWLNSKQFDSALSKSATLCNTLRSRDLLGAATAFSRVQFMKIPAKLELPEIEAIERQAISFFETLKKDFPPIQKKKIDDLKQQLRKEFAFAKLYAQLKRISPQGILNWKDHFTQSIDQFEKDYKDNSTRIYHQFTTLAGFMTVKLLKHEFPLRVEFVKSQFSNSLIKRIAKAAVFFLEKGILNFSLIARFSVLLLKNKQTSKNEPRGKQDAQIEECLNLYETYKECLEEDTLLSELIKDIKQITSLRLFKPSVVCLTAAPLSRSNGRIIEHIIKSPSCFRLVISKTMLDLKLEVNYRFLALTKENLYEDEYQNTIVILETSTVFINGKPHLVFEDSLLQERLEKIEQNMDRIRALKTEYLFIVGTQADIAAKYIRENQVPFKVFYIAGASEKKQDVGVISCLRSRAELKEKQADCLGKILHVLASEGEITIRQRSLQLSDFEASDRLFKKEGISRDISPNKNYIMTGIAQRDQRGPYYIQQGPCIQSLLKNMHQSRCINVYGTRYSGRTTFVKEFGLLCLERELFQEGIFLVRGKDIVGGQIYKYHSNKMSIKKLVCSEKFSHALIIFDDFDVVPSSPQNLATLSELIEKNVILVLVTQTPIKKKELFFQQKIRQIKQIEISMEFTQDEVDAFAFGNISGKSLQDYERRRARCKTGQQTKEISRELFNFVKREMDRLQQPFNPKLERPLKKASREA